MRANELSAIRSGDIVFLASKGGPIRQIVTTEPGHTKADDPNVSLEYLGKAKQDIYDKRPIRCFYFRSWREAFNSSCLAE